MYVSPSHPNPPRTQAPPADQGERLATFPRNGGEELRVTLSEYQGHPYVSLRVWAPGSDGQLWPTKKGCSVRIRELADLVEALGRVEALLDRRPASQERPHRTPTAPGGRAHGPAPRRATASPRPERRGFDAGSLPLDSSEGFDEFGS